MTTPEPAATVIPEADQWQDFDIETDAYLDSILDRLGRERAGAATTLTETARGHLFYSPDQERDKRGRWTSEGGREGSSGIHYEPGAEARLQGILGHQPARVIRGLVGATTGEHVRVTRMQLIATHHDGSQTVAWVSRDAQGHPQLFLFGHGELRTLNQPYDPRRLLAMAEAAHALGITHIGTKGRAHADDHRTLPRLGFDTTTALARNESDFKEIAPGFGTGPRPPAALFRAHWLSEALRDPQARQWWNEHGRHPSLSLSTAPGTYGRDTLEAAVRASAPAGATE